MSLQTASGVRLSGLTQPVLELGEELFHRVQVGRGFGQEEQLGAD